MLRHFVGSAKAAGRIAYCSGGPAGGGVSSSHADFFPLPLLHTKRFAQQNLAAGGIHFRRGLKSCEGAPQNAPPFCGECKSSWTNCILLWWASWRRSKLLPCGFLPAAFAPHQAFCTAKPCRRRNSLPPRIEILRGGPAKCSAILWGVQKQLDELHIALVGQLEEE